MLLSADSMPESVWVGPGDDCAVLSWDGPIAVSTDLTVEGVHFLREWLSPEEIAYRGVATALSDLAAMAAQRAGVLVSLAISDAEPSDLVLRMGAGLREACAEWRIPLVGGDLSRSPGPLILDVTVLGRVTEPTMRSGARPRDDVWVTGLLGAPAAAVRAWRQGTEPHATLREAFARPKPRIPEARWLAEHAPVRAAIDLSDGLGGDAGHLAAAGGVGMVLEADEIPIHPGVLDQLKSREDALRVALSGGEDYELCFVVPVDGLRGVREEFEDRFRLGLTRVGRVVAGSGVWLQVSGESEPRPLVAEGFSHFRPGRDG
jgi:thiamine-monophosphate kinase